MVDHLGLEVKHGTDIVPAVQLDGMVRPGKPVVSLDATESAIEGHLPCPG